MSFLCCDIETIPQARFLDPERYAPPGAPAGGPGIEVQSEWFDERFPGMAFRDFWPQFSSLVQAGEVPLKATGCTPSLHPTTCHVVQVSFGTRKDDGSLWTRLFQLDDYAGDDGGGMEERMLEWEASLLRDAVCLLRKLVVDRNDGLLVTFNGKTFDLPVLRWRSALTKAPVPALPWKRWLYPWDHSPHCDLRIAFTEERRGRGTLQVWSDAFGIHAEEHGHEVWKWVQAGEWALLRNYGSVEQDTLVNLWERVRSFI